MDHCELDFIRGMGLLCKIRNAIMKCPACGAIVDSMALKCPQCGYVFSTESTSAKEIRNRIDLFQSQLLAAGNDEKKAALIRTFTLPNTVEGLMSMLTLASSSFESSNGNAVKMISAAWLEKARQAYRSLKTQGISDRDILSRLEPFSYLEDGKAKVKESSKQKKKKLIVRWLLIALIAAAIIYVFLLVLSNMDVEEPAEKTVRQEVMELIQQKDYDKARIKAAEADYSWDQMELMQMIDEAENK